MSEAMNYEPRGDRVIVKRLERGAQKPDTVFIPQSQQKPLDEGIVVAVGPGARNRVTGYIDSIDLEVGEHVHFLEFAGAPVEIDGEEYLSLREEEIHGKRKP